jgi:hypothetical protein
MISLKKDAHCHFSNEFNLNLSNQLITTDNINMCQLQKNSTNYFLDQVTNKSMSSVNNAVSLPSVSPVLPPVLIVDNLTDLPSKQCNLKKLYFKSEENEKRKASEQINAYSFLITQKIPIETVEVVAETGLYLLKYDSEIGLIFYFNIFKLKKLSGLIFYKIG